MGLFDNLENQAQAIGAKAGLSPQQVKGISETVQSKLHEGAGERQALEAAAAKHGISVAKIQEVLGHAGGSNNLMGELGGLAGGFFKS